MNIWQENHQTLLDTVFDSAVDVWLLIDLEKLSIIESRGNVTELLGRNPQELIDAPVRVLCPEEAPQGLSFTAELLRNPTYVSELWLSHPTLGATVVAMRVEHVVLAGSRTVALVRTHSVSEQVRMYSSLGRMHKELQTAYKELVYNRRSLEEARRAASLSLFAAGLAHELNNPVAICASNVVSVNSYIEDVIAAWPNTAVIPEELHELPNIANDIHKALMRVRVLVDRLSGLDRHFNRSSWDLVPLLNQWATTKATTLHLSVSECRMNSDRFGVEKSIEELLKNAHTAVKPDGRVEIVANVVGHHVVIEVRNQGAKIAEDVLERAFDPFFTTQPPGQALGLGLFLARRNAYALGGQISLNNDVKGWTCARLELPIEMPETKDLRQHYADLRSGMS